MDCKRIVGLSSYICGHFQLCSKCSLVFKKIHNHTLHTLPLSCSQSMQIQTCLLMCTVWLLNSWHLAQLPSPKLHSQCARRLPENFLRNIIFAHYHNFITHEHRELIKQHWPSCHRSISNLLFERYNCLWPTKFFVWYLHKDLRGLSLW
jgi:hypothetical protein